MKKNQAVVEEQPTELVTSALPEEVKLRVNEMLFCCLPGSTTIDTLEVLASDLCNQIEAEWERHKERA